MESTVIILASRFRMISQADKIIVMEDGRIVEFDTPLSLLDNPRSKLSLMISQTGDIDPAFLRQMVTTKSKSKSLKSIKNQSDSRNAANHPNMKNSSSNSINANDESETSSYGDEQASKSHRIENSTPSVRALENLFIPLKQ